MTALRLLPAPGSAPPYDDEHVPRPALRLVPLHDRPVAAPPVRLPPPSLLPPDGPPLRTPSRALPDPHPFARALVQRLVEVCGGVRPVSQLQRDSSPALFADLERALARRPRPQGPRPPGRDVLSVHVQQRPDGVAEVCATVRRAGRWGAVALRLEGVHGRWVCTQVQGV